MNKWLEERFGLGEAVREFKEHPVPPHARHPMYCFGGLTFFCFLIQVFTGIILALYYRPTPEEAYASVQFITNQVTFGAMLRTLHHWTANIMVVMVIFHMLRVFYTGSFKKPRELNWVVGVILLLLSMGFGFTGYLLPWDQVAYWGSVVGTEIMGTVPFIGKYLLILFRGGLHVTEFTLTRFYVAHVMILPVLAMVLMGAHFAMVRIQGISEEL